MSIKSIQITNILSFENLVINDIQDITCIIGKNNVGKSNLLKVINFFYSELEGKRTLPPALNSNYSKFGTITITYDTSRIKRIVTSKKNNSHFLKHIYNTLFRGHPVGLGKLFNSKNIIKNSAHHLTLKLNSNNSVEWSIKEKSKRDIFLLLFPFFEIETRHIDLHDWDKLWNLITQLKTFSLDGIKKDDIVEFFNEKLSSENNSYKIYIDSIEEITSTKKYNYQENILNYVKIGLNGHQFTNDDKTLSVQSDGTNSHQYISLFLKLLVTLTRREYIAPMVFIDEPEVGLHPKRMEELIFSLYETINSFKKVKGEKEIGKFKTPNPKILFSTHSPNILKYTIRLFRDNHKILQFTKPRSGGTQLSTIRSTYSDGRFLNIFSDNEARLFFSSFILFVEGATELELFQNLSLIKAFPELNRVDVYQNNNVTHKYIEPKYSKLAIPTLTIYDADVLFEVDLKNSEIKLKKNFIDLYKFKLAHEKRFYSKDRTKAIGNIKSILKLNKTKIQLNSSKTSIDNFDLGEAVEFTNSNILINENLYLTPNTIEGSLINSKSLSIFKEWLQSEVENLANVNLRTKHIKLKINQYKAGKLTLDKSVSDLFSQNESNTTYSEEIQSELNQIKDDYTKEMFNYVKSRTSSDSEEAMYFRLFFKGKTNSLHSTKNGSYQKNVCSKFQSDFKEFSAIRMAALSLLGNKTSGWVTLFLDFSIKRINSNSKDNQDFTKNFINTFPDLYGIIKTVSSSID